MKKKRLSYDAYDQLKQSLQGLSWTWQVYQDRFPDGWYEFKYSPRLRKFIEQDIEGVLLSQAQHKRFPRRVIVPQQVYNEMNELTAIHHELQEALAKPIVVSFTNKKSREAFN